MRKLKTILILIIIAFSFQLIASPAIAQDAQESLNFEPQVSIPDSDFTINDSIPVGTLYKYIDDTSQLEITKMSSTLLPRYIKAIYKYGIGISSFLALIMIVAGGLIWLTSAGSPDKIGKAKTIITSSIIGLILLLGTYTMAELVNPALLSLKPIETKYIGPTQLGCCEVHDYDDHGNILGTEYKTISGDECEAGYGTFHEERIANNDNTACIYPNETMGCCQPLEQGDEVFRTDKATCEDKDGWIFKANWFVVDSEDGDGKTCSANRFIDTNIGENGCSGIAPHACTGFVCNDNLCEDEINNYLICCCPENINGECVEGQAH